MKETYGRAMKEVYLDEGTYSNDAGDPGGPTNYGITIFDARHYWKHDATAEDVKHMPKSIAEDIYAKHYAIPLHYNDLPSGVDYAVLDYGINSGISRSARVLQRIVGAKQDGVIGEETIKDANQMDPIKLINAIYDERLRFLRSLKTYHIFRRGWEDRCKRGRALALSMAGKKPTPVGPIATVGTVMAGTAAAAASPQHWWPWILGGVVIVLLTISVYELTKGKKDVQLDGTASNPV